VSNSYNIDCSFFVCTAVTMILALGVKIRGQDRQAWKAENRGGVLGWGGSWDGHLAPFPPPIGVWGALQRFSCILLFIYYATGAAHKNAHKRNIDAFSFIDARWLFLAFRKLLVWLQPPNILEHVNAYPELSWWILFVKPLSCYISDSSVKIVSYKNISEMSQRHNSLTVQIFSQHFW